jgi:hypothetical protein
VWVRTQHPASVHVLQYPPKTPHRPHEPRPARSGDPRLS